MEAILKQIFEYASAILSLVVFLCTAVMFIVNQIKKKHRRVEEEERNEKLQNELSIENEKYKLINEIIPTAIAIVEEMPLINGPTKKMIALSKILLMCNNDKISFKSYEKFINEQLENLITFTKKVNKRDKDVINLPVEEKAE